MANRVRMPAILVLAGLLTQTVPALPRLRGDETDRCRAAPDKARQRGPSDSEAGAKEREIERRLLAPVNLNFQDTSLRQVIDDLRSWHGVNIVPDEPALQEEGITLDRPVSIKLEGVALKSALGLLLHQARLTYVVEDQVLKITTPNHAKGKLVQRVYPVADLVVPIPGCPGPAAGPKAEDRPAAAGQKGSRTATVELGPNPQQTTEDQLIKLIKDTLAPRSWGDQGGAGTIDYHPLTMALVINQTQDIHEQITDLLAALRRLQDVEILLEVRVVSLAEGLGESTVKELGAECKEYEPKVGTPLKVTHLNDMQLFLFLEAIQGDHRTRILQAPKLTTCNGQKATINVTDQLTFQTAIDVRWNGDQVVSLPRQEVIPVGLRMTVQPVASADRRSVRLSLNASLTYLEGSSVPLFPVTTRIPSVTERGRELVPFTQYLQMPRVVSGMSCDKTLQIPEGATAVLQGNWKQPRECRNEFGPPVLGQTPYVNRLFKNVGCGRPCEEVVLLVTPRIVVNEQEEVRPASAATPAPMPRVVEDAAVRTAAATPSTVEPPRAAIKEAVARRKKPARSNNPPGEEAWPALRAKKKVARIMEKYYQACADGRLTEARELASKALALDPACFSRER